jgi:hypothetical protein
VIEKKIADRLERDGIDPGQEASLAKTIEEETDAERLARARAEMNDEERARLERLARPAQGAGDIPRARRRRSP